MRILEPEMRTDTDVDALSRGRAFVDLSRWRKVAVRGADARSWLNGLVSADIGDLRPGEARRSLLLSPTGAVRAEFTIAAVGDELMVLQDPDQERPVDSLLAPYVLSADVRLADRADELAVFAFPLEPAGLGEAAGLAGSERTRPSCVGDGAGVDVLTPRSDHDRAVAALSVSHRAVGPGALEAWRVAAGIPSATRDVSDGDLPDEVGLAGAVAGDKGCYLGQEAVAKARNLGHPRRILVHVTADAPLMRGDEVRAGESAVGTITSVAEVDGRSVALARVQWGARERSLTTGSGARLTPARRPD